jgi:putative nucleotidyltransferase with HDIG domain
MASFRGFGGVRAAAGRGARPVSGTAVDPEEAFVAGLLHDIGKTLLSTCVPDYLPLVREYALAQEMPFAEAERLLLGFDHAQAGAGLAERWKLPPGLVHAIACHHDPLAAAGTPADRDLACIAHVAEALCLMLGIGVGSDGLLFALQPEALDLLGIQGRQDALLSEFLEALGRVGPAFDFAAGS